MNKTEKKMRDILTRGREEFGVVSVKAEFEAEGTRIDELLRLVDISRSAGLPAPMVETAYALSKYSAATNLIYTEEEREDTDFLFNLETITGFENLAEMVEEASKPNSVNGMVFGRVDFAGSLGLTRDSINTDEVTNYVLTAAKAAKDAKLDFVMGGAISSDSLHVIRQVAYVHLTRFETRKVVFGGDATTIDNIEQGLVNAVHFEMLWLLNKRDYYARITAEDSKRIEMLEARWKLLND